MSEISHAPSKREECGIHIAEAIKLKGLTGQTSSELLDEHGKQGHFEPAKMSKRLFTTLNTTGNREPTTPDTNT